MSDDSGRALVVDHVLVLCEVDAPEAETLTWLGFIEGPPNRHPGQGTACRRFFFGNLYLELAWVHDSAEARRAPALRTGLWDRWSQRGLGACPFGVILRSPRDTQDAGAPFRTWSYRPEYVGPGSSIEVALDAPLSEPAFFWLPSNNARLPSRPPAGDQHLGRDVTAVRIGIPSGVPHAEAARIAAAQGCLAFERSDDPLLELTLDDGRQGEVADLRAALPLRLRW